MLKEKDCQVSFCFSTYVKQPTFLRHHSSKHLEHMENKLKKKIQKQPEADTLSAQKF